MLATLALETGSTFAGRLFGAPGFAAGEIVFHTGMTGYQEILTDPSYAGQIVVFTAPHIGNYGIHRGDFESGKIHPAAVIVRDHCRRTFHHHADRSLDEFLRSAHVTGLSDVDTRALTIELRDRGTCRGALGPGEAWELLERARSFPPISAVDWVERVTTDRPYDFEASAAPPEGGAPFRVAVLDFGIKRSILTRMAAEGCCGRVYPARTAVDEILASGAEGVFLSNGPGDPATLSDLVEVIGRLLRAEIPLFGICLGHQLLARALGATTVKLPFGHHGANHPVRRLSDNRVEITSQNHNYAVPVDSLDEKLAAITHVSLNDDTVEGLEVKGRPVYSVQFHPEAAPGPRDSHYLFRRFRLDMAARRAECPSEDARRAAHPSEDARRTAGPSEDARRAGTASGEDQHTTRAAAGEG